MQTARALHQSVPEYTPWEVSVGEVHTMPVRMTGLPASEGIVEGPCTVIKDLADLHTIKEGTILVCEAPLPTIAPYMELLSGLVAGRGGPQCITAGYAREYGIPAVVGVEGIMITVKTGDVIRIDGSRGTVRIIG